MGRFQAIIIIGCMVTFVVFGVMCYLMTTVNPPPLPEARDLSKHDSLVDELSRVTLGPQTTDNETKNSSRRTSQISYRQDSPGLLKDKATKNYKTLSNHLIQRVMSPIWPPKPRIEKTVRFPEKRALNETVQDCTKCNTSTIDDTLPVIKRSVNDVKQLGGDLNSIVLKIIDDSGQFNIEINIGLNDVIVKKKNKTKEDKIRSKDKSKYSISLKTKDNDQFKKTNLAKNTIIRVMPNDFVTVVEYDEHLEAKNKIKNNMIQASIVDFNNITKYNIIENKATEVPIYRDVFKPIVIFYNQTKSIYHSERDLLEKPNVSCKTNHNSFKTVNNTGFNVTTQTEKEEKTTEKGDLLEKPNNARDGFKTNLNSFMATHNTAYNLTTHTEKANNTGFNVTTQTEKGQKIEKGNLLEKPNNASDGCKMNINTSKTANNTSFNVTTQTEKGEKITEKGDLLEKPNNTRNGCKMKLNSFKKAYTAYNLTTHTEKANNTAYNLTVQTEKVDKSTEKGELLKKPNDVSDGSKTNVNSSKTAYDLTTQTVKRDKKSEKEDLLEKASGASDGCKTNLNSFMTANNTGYNLTTHTEKTSPQYYFVTTKNENTTVEAENSTILTKTVDETSTMAGEVNPTIPLPNGSSIQNYTRDLIEMKKVD